MLVICLKKDKRAEFLMTKMIYLVDSSCAHVPNRVKRASGVTIYGKRKMTVVCNGSTQRENCHENGSKNFIVTKHHIRQFN